MKTLITILFGIICISAANLFSYDFKYLSKLNVGMNTNKITSIVIDKSNNKWMGSESIGLIKFDGETCQVYNDLSDPICDFINISNIAIDSSDNIWLSSPGCSYFLQYDILNNKFIKKDPFAAVNIPSYDKFGFDSKGDLIAVKKMADTIRILKFNLKTAIIQDTFYVNDFDNYFNGITSFFIDKNDLIWLGFEINNCKTALISYGDNKFTTIQHSYFPINFQYTIKITSILMDKNNELFLTTDRSGIYKMNSFDTSEKRQNFIKEKVGNMEDILFSSCVDNFGNKFFGGYSILTKCDSLNKKWDLYDGKPPSAYIQEIRAIVPDRNNYIWGIMRQASSGVDFSCGVFCFSSSIIDESLWKTVGVDDNISSNVSISFFPNPANEEISISFSNSEIPNRDISIFNSLGIEIKRFDEKDLLGRNSISFSTEEFPSGVYYCALTTGTNIITKNFVVVK